jgi:hypothetical protein
VNKATEEDFNAKGIDLYYFKMLNKDVSGINMGIKNVDACYAFNAEKLFNDFKKDIKMQIENLSR